MHQTQLPTTAHLWPVKWGRFCTVIILRGSHHQPKEKTTLSVDGPTRRSRCASEGHKRVCHWQLWPADCKLPIWFQQVSAGLYDLSILTCFCGPSLAEASLLLAATKQKQLPNIWSSIWTVTRVVIRWWASGIFLWFFYELKLISRVPVFLWKNKIFIHFFFFFFFLGFSWSRMCGWWHESLSEGAASWLIRNKWLGSITSIKCHPRGSVRFQLTSNQWKCL